MDEQQLSALINAAVREAVERTTAELTSQFETATAGLRKNRDELLAEKKTSEGKQPEPVTHDNFDEWLAGLDARMAKAREVNARLLGQSSPEAFVPKQTEVTITREAARSGSAYRAAKAEAEAKGLPLRIVDEHRSAPGPAPTSRVKYVEDSASRTIYANKDVLREAGGLQRLKDTAQRDGKRVIVFRSLDDLPAHLHRTHAETLAAQKPDTLLEGGE